MNLPSHQCKATEWGKKSVWPPVAQLNFRVYGGVLLAVVLTLLLCQCGSTAVLSSIQVIPQAGMASATRIGQTVQYQATGQYTNGKHPGHSADITNQVTWTSSSVSVGTISASGLLTVAGPGSSTIVASMDGVTGTSDITSTATPGTSGPVRTLTSLTIIPATGIQILTVLGETAQYIAIGSFTADPATQDMTDQVKWASSDVRVATINSSGLATAIGSGLEGKTTITAMATSSTGAVITATSDLTVSSSGTNNLPSLTVYEVGQGTGTVTSAPSGISCGSGAGCTGHFVLNSTVSLTAVPANDSTFGGWSANCTPSNAPLCSLLMTDNATVGAIFNLK